MPDDPKPDRPAMRTDADKFLSGEVESLRAGVEKLDGSVKDLTTGVSSLGGQVHSLLGFQKQAEGFIARIEGYESTVKKVLPKVRSAGLKALVAILAVVFGGVGSAVGSVWFLATRASDYTNEIKHLSQSMGEVKDELKTSINRSDERHDKLTKGISDLTVIVGQHTVQIEGLRKSLSESSNSMKDSADQLAKAAKALGMATDAQNQLTARLKTTEEQSRENFSELRNQIGNLSRMRKLQRPLTKGNLLPSDPRHENELVCEIRDLSGPEAAELTDGMAGTVSLAPESSLNAQQKLLFLQRFGKIRGHAILTEGSSKKFSCRIVLHNKDPILLHDLRSELEERGRTIVALMELIAPRVR